jgi:hypothetical protein
MLLCNEVDFVFVFFIIGIGWLVLITFDCLLKHYFLYHLVVFLHFSLDFLLITILFFSFFFRIIILIIVIIEVLLDLAIIDVFVNELRVEGPLLLLGLSIYKTELILSAVGLVMEHQVLSIIVFPEGSFFQTISYKRFKGLIETTYSTH